MTSARAPINELAATLSQLRAEVAHLIGAEIEFIAKRQWTRGWIVAVRLSDLALYVVTAEDAAAAWISHVRVHRVITRSQPPEFVTQRRDGLIATRVLGHGAKTRDVAHDFGLTQGTVAEIVARQRRAPAAQALPNEGLS